MLYGFEVGLIKSHQLRALLGAFPYSGSSISAEHLPVPVASNVQTYRGVLY